jgi:hypothetical protein
LLQGWRLAVLMGMTSMIALIIGSCVPVHSHLEAATADNRKGAVH